MVKNPLFPPWLKPHGFHLVKNRPTPRAGARWHAPRRAAGQRAAAFAGAAGAGDVGGSSERRGGTEEPFGGQNGHGGTPKLDGLEFIIGKSSL